MIDDCSTVEELDQCNHAVELEVAQFTLTRFISISAASSGTGGESPETQTVLGTWLAWLNISPTQHCWVGILGAQRQKECSTEMSLDICNLLDSIGKGCTLVLNLESKAEVYLGNFQGF